MDIVAVVSYYVISTLWAWICNDYFIGSYESQVSLWILYLLIVPFKYNSPMAAFGDHFVKNEILSPVF